MPWRSRERIDVRVRNKEKNCPEVMNIKFQWIVREVILGNVRCSNDVSNSSENEYHEVPLKLNRGPVREN
jgi:hypothetical protein